MALDDSIEELLREIEETRACAKDSARFIAKRGLVLVKPVHGGLPGEFAYGTIYLIKNQSIVESQTGLVLERPNLFSNEMEMRWKGVITFHNLLAKDVAEFENPQRFLGREELVTYSMERAEGFLKNLMGVKFEVYVKK
jgi:hypothetical protein